ncbi:hypothetical protein B0H13DRAFT_2356282 [Mycena leptocephala]|nr:hypothetical protein B0H13DRAFT_2356282 [Mycena leptocephala]
MRKRDVRFDFVLFTCDISLSSLRASPFKFPPSALLSYCNTSLVSFIRSAHALFPPYTLSDRILH